MNEDHFTAFKDIINALDPKSADFSFEAGNLRSAVQISVSLTQMEKRELLSLLQALTMPK